MKTIKVIGTVGAFVLIVMFMASCCSGKRGCGARQGCGAGCNKPCCAPAAVK